MKLLLKILIVLLLLINGAGAVYGGLHLMINPDGSSLGLSPAFIEGTVFGDYFIPGLVLFIFNGVLSFIVIALLLTGYQRYPSAVAIEGLVLLSWLLVQIVVIRYVYFLHFVMGAAGLGLVVLGITLQWMARRSESVTQDKITL